MASVSREFVMIRKYINVIPYCGSQFDNTYRFCHNGDHVVNDAYFYRLGSRTVNKKIALNL